MNESNKQLPTDPLINTSIEEISKKLRNGSITCFQLTSTYCRRINILNAKLHAYIYFDEDRYKSDKIFYFNKLKIGDLINIENTFYRSSIQDALLYNSSYNGGSGYTNNNTDLKQDGYERVQNIKDGRKLWCET